MAHQVIKDSCGFFCRGSVSCEVRAQRVRNRTQASQPCLTHTGISTGRGHPLPWEPSPIWTQRQEPALLDRHFRAPGLGSFIPAGPGSPPMPQVRPPTEPHQVRGYCLQHLSPGTQVRILVNRTDLVLVPRCFCPSGPGKEATDTSETKMEIIAGHALEGLDCDGTTRGPSWPLG